MEIFSFSDWIKYWDVLCEYINPYHVIIWGVAGGILGFLLTLFVVIWLRKKILVPRKYTILKVLSYCYLVFFPLFIGFIAFQLSAVHNFERQVVKNIPKYLGETNQLFNTYLKAEVIKIISEETLKSSGNDLLDKTVKGAQSIAGTLLKDKASELWASDTETGFKDVVASYVTSVLAETGFVRTYLVSGIKQKIGNVLLMDKKTANEFFDVEIGKILDSGILNTVLEKHTKNITGGLKMNVLLLLLLVVALPVIEIIIANRIYQNKSSECDDLYPSEI